METVEIKITDEFLKDVLITICETPGAYGIAYWADVVKANENTAQLWYDVEEDEEGNRKGRFALGLRQIAEGIRKILTLDKDTIGLHPSNAAIVCSAVIANDSGQIDGEAADWIAQAAIFGKVIYG